MKFIIIATHWKVMHATETTEGCWPNKRERDRERERELD